MIIDLAIIGSGPNGIFALNKVKKELSFFKTVCFEKGEILQNMRDIPNVRWHSRMKELFFGIDIDKDFDPDYMPKTYELIEYYKFFINQNKLEIKENHELIDIKKLKNPELYELTFQNKKTIQSKYIFLSTGIYLNKRTLSIETAQINYNFNFYKDKNLGLIGSGNSACDFIIHNLKNNKIFWIIRGENLKNVDSTIKEILHKVINENKNNLTVLYNTEIINYENKTLTLNNNKKINNIDNVTALIGFNSKTELFNKINLRFQNECVDSNENYETNLKNVFLIGSINSKWDHNKKTVEPTFIHNGNPEKTMKAINYIRKNLISEVFPEMKRSKPKKFKWIKH